MVILSAFVDEISPDLETQLDVLESEGIAYLELRSVWNKNVLKLSDAEVEQIKERFDARGFQVSSIGSPIGKVKITDDFESHIQDLKHAIALAKIFNTRNIRIFSFFIPEGHDADEYENEVMRRMRAMVQLAEEADVVLLHENEKDIYGDIEARCRKLHDAIPSPHLRSAFDPANYVQCGVMPMSDAYPLLEPYIAYVHVKDALKETRKVVPAGEGDGQLAELVGVLKSKAYAGFMSIEHHISAEGKFEGCSGSERFVAASKALKKLLKVAELDWK